MTSRGIILILCYTAMITYWLTTGIITVGIPLAFCTAFIIMDWTGMFKREVAKAKGPNLEVEDGLSERQKEFKRKMAATPNQDISAVLNLIDSNGNRSTITINPDGEIILDGDPDPEIVEAAEQLRESVIQLGPEYIAKAIQKELAKQNTKTEHEANDE